MNKQAEMIIKMIIKNHKDLMEILGNLYGVDVKKLMKELDAD